MSEGVLEDTLCAVLQWLLSTNRVSDLLGRNLCFVEFKIAIFLPVKNY